MVNSGNTDQEETRVKTYINNTHNEKENMSEDTEKIKKKCFSNFICLQATQELFQCAGAAMTKYH